MIWLICGIIVLAVAGAIWLERAALYPDFPPEIAEKMRADILKRRRIKTAARKK